MTTSLVNGSVVVRLLTNPRIFTSENKKQHTSSDKTHIHLPLHMPMPMPIHKHIHIHMHIHIHIHLHLHLHLHIHIHKKHIHRTEQHTEELNSEGNKKRRHQRESRVNSGAGKKSPVTNIDTKKKNDKKTMHMCGMVDEQRQ